MTRLRRLLAVVAVLAYLATSTLGAGWVVCSGDDGHVAIEALGSDCCDDDAPAHRDDDCGECDDVLLAHASPATKIADELPDVRTSVVAVMPRPSLCDLPGARDVLCATPRGPPRPPPLPRHLSSTVLRL